MSMHKGLIGKSEGGGSADRTLGDYITRKQRQDAFDQVAQEKKLTFDEWYNSTEGAWVVGVVNNECSKEEEIVEALLLMWQVAQENK